MSNSAQLTKHQIATVFSGLTSELEELIKEQEAEVKHLKEHAKDIKQYVGKMYPSNPLKQDREAEGWLRVAVWRKLYPLKARVKENKELLSRMKRKENSTTPSNRVDVADVKDVPISAYIDFNKQGKAQCIWHNDKNPSLHYYAKDNRVHCFSCGAGGDVVDVIQKLHECTFKEALTVLSNG